MDSLGINFVDVDVKKALKEDKKAKKAEKKRLKKVHVTNIPVRALLNTFVVFYHSLQVHVLSILLALSHNWNVIPWIYVVVRILEQILDPSGCELLDIFICGPHIKDSFLFSGTSESSLSML